MNAADGPRLDGRLCWLVPFEAAHVEDADYLGWLHDREVVKTLNLPRYLESPPTIEELRAYWQALQQSDAGMQQSDAGMMFAIHDRSDGAFVGTLKIGRIDRWAETGDLGIMIGRRDRWGRGLATDALAAAARYAFGTLGLRKLTAGAMASNVAMLRAFERLGFRQEGVLRGQDRCEGGYVDHVYLGCFRDELRLPEAGPAAVAAREGKAGRL